MRRLLQLAVPALCVLLFASATQGQEPPRRPPRDTLAARDTTAADTTAALADSLKQAADTTPPPRFSAILGGPAPAVAGNVFYWDRDALLREAALTLGDLLEQVPGMTVLRAGLFQQPEAGSAFGLTRGRIEVVMDGFVLDPLTSSTLDLATIELAQIAELRVERRLDLIRIYLTTIEPLVPTPYSRLDAGTGQPSGSLLRAVFTSPRLLVGPFAFAIDRIDGSGRDGAEPTDAFGGWTKLGWFPSPNRAIQVEYQTSRLRRKAGVPWVGEQTRSDLVLRARNRFFEGFAAEVFAGRSKLGQPSADSLGADSTAVRLQREEWQYGARAALRKGIAWLDAELRFRDAEALPSRQLDLGGGLELASLVHVAGNVTSSAWRSGPSALAYDVRAELGPVAGLAAFAEHADGERGAPLWADSAGRTTLESHVLETRAGTRIGVTARRFGIEATGALIRVEADSAAPFGLPFDSVFGPTIASPAEGLEVYGRIPLWPRGLSVTGNFNYWNKVGGLLYLPSRGWRVALELHTLPIPSGNLEILGRIEHQRREAMLERNPESADSVPTDPALRYTTMPIRNLLNGYLQIRVIDVRAFIQYYDMLGGGREDFPGRGLVRGPRILYGVKWQLFN